ncbi:MAG TPA: hypothetical protein VGJ45_30625 [Pseudonocardiaceae bacterium]|jgi:hypothetical protein
MNRTTLCRTGSSTAPTSLQEIQAAHWPAPRYDAIMAALIVVIVLQAHAMWRRGPISRLTVPVVTEPVESAR